MERRQHGEREKRRRAVTIQPSTFTGFLFDFFLLLLFPLSLRWKYTQQNGLFHFYDYFFFHVVHPVGRRDEESERAAAAAAAASCPGQRYAKSFFSSFFILFCEREGSALPPTRAMVVLCVFITLKPGSRKAEEEEKKRENILPKLICAPVSCTSFFFSLYFSPFQQFREK